MWPSESFQPSEQTSRRNGVRNARLRLISATDSATVGTGLRAHPCRIFFCTFCTFADVLLYFRYSTSPGSDVLCFRVLCTSESTNRASIFHENLMCILNPETYFSKYIVLLLRSVLFVIKIIAQHAAHCSHYHHCHHDRESVCCPRILPFSFSSCHQHSPAECG